MPRNTWRAYATKKRSQSKGGFREYLRAEPFWVSTKTSYCDFPGESREVESPQENKIHEEEKMKKNVEKKVLKHLKEDTHEFKEQIADDKKLKKMVQKTVKKKKGK